MSQKLPVNVTPDFKPPPDIDMTYVRVGEAVIAYPTAMEAELTRPRSIDEIYAEAGEAFKNAVPVRG